MKTWTYLTAFTTMLITSCGGEVGYDASVTASQNRNSTGGAPDVTAQLKAGGPARGGSMATGGTSSSTTNSSMPCGLVRKSTAVISQQEAQCPSRWSFEIGSDVDASTPWSPDCRTGQTTNLANTSVIYYPMGVTNSTFAYYVGQCDSSCEGGDGWYAEMGTRMGGYWNIILCPKTCATVQQGSTAAVLVGNAKTCTIE